MVLEPEQIESKLSSRPYSPLFTRLAYEYLSANRVEDAKELCMKGIEKYPLYTTAHLILARCYDTENNFNSAIESLRIAKTLNPTSPIITELFSKLEELQLTTEIEVVESEVAEIATMQSAERNENISADVELPTTISDLYTSTSNFDQNTPLVSEQQIDTISDLMSEDKTADVTENEMPSVSFVSTSPIENEITAVPNTISEELSEIIPLPTAPIIESENILREAEPVIEQQIEPCTQQPIEDEQLPEIESPVQETNLPIEEGGVVQLPIPVAQSDKQTTNIEDGARIVSKTLAEIYATQGEYQEAIITYQLLKKQQPSRSEEIDKRISELEENIRTNPDA